MATTQRAIRVEREENITALLLDIVSAVKVLAALYTDQRELDRLMRVLVEIEHLKHEAIERRNGKPARQ